MIWRVKRIKYIYSGRQKKRNTFRFSCFKAPYWCPSKKVICSLESWWSEDYENGLKHFPAPILSRVMDDWNFFPTITKNIIFYPPKMSPFSILAPGPLFLLKWKKSSWTGNNNARTRPWGKNCYFFPKKLPLGAIFNFGP